MSFKLSLTCFEHVTVHHKGFCTSSLQYFTVHLKKGLVADMIRMIISTLKSLEFSEVVGHEGLRGYK